MKKKELVRRQNEWEDKVGGVPLFIGVWEHTGVSTQSAGKYNKIMHTGATAETPVCYFIICMHIGVVGNADMHIKKIIAHIGVPRNADMRYFIITLIRGDSQNAGKPKHLTKNFLGSVGFGKRVKVRGSGYKYAYM